MAKAPNFLKLQNSMDKDIQNLNNTTTDSTPSQFNDRLVREDTSITAIHDLYMIPIEKLITFRQKGDRDFSAWNEEDLNALAEQMDSEGAYEPIIVRKIESDDKYEILAGEHRVKASKIKGLKKIKAIVYRGCSDEKAMDIFLLTNLHRRTTKISDCIYGWSMFSKNHPNMRGVKELEEHTQGITEVIGTDKVPITMAQFYRYVRMSKLIDKLIQALDEGIISTRVGYELSIYEQEEQRLFLPFLSNLTEEKLRNLRVHLKESGNELTTDIIKSFVLTRHVNNYDASLRYNITKVKTIIKTKIAPEKFSELEQIMQIAIDDFLAKNPDYKNPNT